MKATALATVKQLRISPRKVRLLVDLIRHLPIAEARVQLRFSQKDAARPVLKLLESAVANATHNHAIREETLTIAKAFVDGGPSLHRWTPKAFGRANPIRKRTSHVTIVLEGERNEQTSKQADKQDNEQIEDNIKDNKTRSKVVSKQKTEENKTKAKSKI